MHNPICSYYDENARSFGYREVVSTIQTSHGDIVSDVDTGIHGVSPYIDWRSRKMECNYIREYTPKVSPQSAYIYICSMGIGLATQRLIIHGKMST